MFFAVDAKFFVGNEKKKSTIFFLVNSNKIYIDPYLNENFVRPTKFLFIQQNICLGVKMMTKAYKWSGDYVYILQKCTNAIITSYLRMLLQLKLIKQIIMHNKNKI